MRTPSPRGAKNRWKRAIRLWAGALALLAGAFAACAAAAETPSLEKDIIVFLDGSTTIVGGDEKRPSLKLRDMLRTLFRQTTEFGPFLGGRDHVQVIEFGQKTKLIADSIGPGPKLDAALDAFAGAQNRGQHLSDFRPVFQEAINAVAVGGERPQIVLIASDFVHDPVDRICQVWRDQRTYVEPALRESERFAEAIKNKTFYVGLLIVTPEDNYLQSAARVAPSSAKSKKKTGKSGPTNYVQAQENQGCFDDYKRAAPIVGSLTKPPVDADKIEFESLEADARGFAQGFATRILSRLLKPVDVQLGEDDAVEAAGDDRFIVPLTLVNRGSIPNLVKAVHLFKTRSDSDPVASRSFESDLVIPKGDKETISVELSADEARELFGGDAIFVGVDDRRAAKASERIRIADPRAGKLTVHDISLAKDSETLNFTVKNDGRFPAQVAAVLLSHDRGGVARETPMEAPPLAGGSSQSMSSVIPSGFLEDGRPNQKQIFVAVRNNWGKAGEMLPLAIAPATKLKIAKVQPDEDRGQLIVTVRNQDRIANALSGFYWYDRRGKNQGVIPIAGTTPYPAKQEKNETVAIDWKKLGSQQFIYLMAKDQTDKNVPAYDENYGYYLNLSKIFIEITSMSRQRFVGSDTHYRIALDYKLFSKNNGQTPPAEYEILAHLVYKDDPTIRVPLVTIPKTQRVTFSGEPEDESIILAAYPEDEEKLKKELKEKLSAEYARKDFEAEIRLKDPRDGSDTAIMGSADAFCVKDGDFCSWLDRLRLKIQPFYFIVVAFIAVCVVVVARSFRYLSSAAWENALSSLRSFASLMGDLGVPVWLLLTTLGGGVVAALKLGSWPYNNLFFLVNTGLCLILALYATRRYNIDKIDDRLSRRVRSGGADRSLETLFGMMKKRAWIWGGAMAAVVSLIFLLFSPPLYWRNFFDFS